MKTLIRFRGRGFTEAEVAFVRQFISEHPGDSRWALSRKLCEAWGWVQPNGALRDMVPNHLFQLLALTAMEPPTSFEADAVRSEKAKILQAIPPPTHEDVLTRVVRGQYGEGRRDGEKLAGRAFNPKEPLIVVGDLATETGRNRQRGVMLIAQGIFAGVRNPLAHQRIVVPAPEARQIVAMIAFVVEAVEARR